MIENNSIWAERVKEIIKHLDIANLAYCPLHMFEQRILYEITVVAKNRDLNINETQSKCPWITSSEMLVIMGTHPPEHQFDLTKDPRFHAHLDFLVNSGWTMGDVLQATSWQKECMVYYPTPEQWAQVFSTTPQEIEALQGTLASSVYHLFNDTERRIWSMFSELGCSLKEWESFHQTALDYQIQDIPDVCDLSLMHGVQ